MQAKVRDLIIEPLARKDIHVAAQVLAAAFAAENLYAHVLRDVALEDRAPLLIPFFSLFLKTYLPAGGIRVAWVDSALAGVALEAPPGHKTFATRYAKIRFGIQLMVVLRRMRRRAPSAARELLKAGRAIQSFDPEEPSWDSMWIGTAPNFQGRGIATSFSKQLIARADREGTHCHLVTFGQQMKRLTEGAGYVVFKEIQPLPGGPSGWVLRRQPSPAPQE